MEKLKLLFIFCLGIFTFGYYIFSGNILEVMNDSDFVVLLQGQIAVSSNDTYIGTLFDYLIYFLFHVNIHDLNTFVRLFGG